MEKFDPKNTSRFDEFEILTAVYKVVSNHEITVDVLYPKTTTSSATASPVLVRFHGGGFIAGSSLFPDFFAPWHMSLAKQHCAVIVSPNYRLLPESTMQDILEDLDDFWAWVQDYLPTFITEQTHGKVQVDLSRVMTAGDSAGGYLSLQLALTYPHQIRSVTAAYPGVDMGHPHFVGKSYKEVFGLPRYPDDLLSIHISKVEQQKDQGHQVIVSSDPDLARGPLMFAAVQHGQYGPFMPEDETKLFPIKRLEEGARFPRGGVVVWHGRDDSVVPVQCSYKLRDTISRLDPDLAFKLVVEDGEHGFDAASKIEDAWMVEALDHVVSAWLR